MFTSSIRPLTGLLGLAAAVVLAAGGTAKDAVPETVSSAMAQADIATLAKLVDKKPDDATIPTIKGVAMYLALYAQTNIDGADADKMVALRANALKVAELAKKKATAKDYDALKAAVADLKAGKAPAKADAKAMKLHTLYEFDVNEAMAPFRSSPRGLNTEKDLQKQAKKVSDVKAVGQIGARAAYVGEYSLLLPPAEATGAKKKQWDDWSKEMAKLGQEVADEAAKGTKADTKVLQKKVMDLDANCGACHKVFKSN